MNLDFEKSLTYIAKDPQWVSKLLIGAFLLLGSMAIFAVPVLVMILSTSILSTVSTFVLCFVVSFLVCMAFAGYFCVTSNSRIHDPEAVLPDWNNFGKYILTGIKYFVGYFLYVLPAMILSFIFGAVFFVAAVNADYSSGFGEFVGFGFLVLCGAAALFTYILTVVFLPLMITNFNKELKTLSFVDFKNAWSLVSCNWGNYVVLILLFIALSVLGQIICMLLCMTVVGIIFVPVVYFYIYLVLADLIAQFAKTK